MNAVTGVSADGSVPTGWGTKSLGGVTGGVATIPTLACSRDNSRGALIDLPT